ncbi:hypothetical protein EMIT0P258_20403 [Pseudomonas sp. IT-P258]
MGLEIENLFFVHPIMINKTEGLRPMQFFHSS